MAIGARYDGILGAACDVIARRGFHQASIREIAQAAGLSLAGLYHYVGGKPELLFLVLDRSLDRLIADLDRALARAGTPEKRLRELIRTHLDFGFHHAAALRIINRDWELLDEPQRAEVAAKREAYLARGLGVLGDLDPHRRSEAELHSATNLLLGMLNGIATRPFLRSPEDTHALAAEVGTLFLHGFLERPMASETAGAVTEKATAIGQPGCCREARAVMRDVTIPAEEAGGGSCDLTVTSKEAPAGASGRLA